jgi:hypothetical protein
LCCGRAKQQLVRQAQQPAAFPCRKIAVTAIFLDLLPDAFYFRLAL